MSATTHKMTKGKARELAKQARRYGYSDHGHDRIANANRVSVRCPQCGEPVVTYWSRLYGRVSLNATLDTAVVEHLIEDCEDGS